MKKSILIVVLLCVVVAYANNQEDFQLGVYSHLSNKQYIYDYRTLFKDWMKTLSYNVNIVNLYLEGTQPNGEWAYDLAAFATMMEEMNADSIDAIINDLRALPEVI